jgi:hypothetical protein
MIRSDQAMFTKNDRTAVYTILLCVVYCLMSYQKRLR